MISDQNNSDNNPKLLDDDLSHKNSQKESIEAKPLYDNSQLSSQTTSYLKRVGIAFTLSISTLVSSILNILISVSSFIVNCAASGYINDQKHRHDCSRALIQNPKNTQDSDISTGTNLKNGITSDYKAVFKRATTLFNPANSIVDRGQKPITAKSVMMSVFLALAIPFSAIAIGISGFFFIAAIAGGLPLAVTGIMLGVSVGLMAVCTVCVGMQNKKENGLGFFGNLKHNLTNIGISIKAMLVDIVKLPVQILLIPLSLFTGIKIVDKLYNKASDFAYGRAINHAIESQNLGKNSQQTAEKIAKSLSNLQDINPDIHKSTSVDLSKEKMTKSFSNPKNMNPDIHKSTSVDLSKEKMTKSFSNPRNMNPDIQKSISVNPNEEKKPSTPKTQQTSELSYNSTPDVSKVELEKEKSREKSTNDTLSTDHKTKHVNKLEKTRNTIQPQQERHAK
ncbi:MAG: hypothetical protein P857_655 [Candidatus Xenolissoclinum pacificiensis L6]|uniref:Uncharacterized protein n=1 Tax=Candidatus Xenolissoclinum pacificiensis L6 TaxID=1401685 RepID=W2V0I4_9RICK|nr:MAG: hypothetical protein P857_655 [Candidatus Xenolissoclinum pacificiensis L6]